MDMMFLGVQALGLLGSVLVIGSAQFNNRKVILAAQAIACVLWIVHYGMLGALTGVTINICSFLRSFIFSREEKWAKNKAWLWFFLGLYLINAAVTWGGIESLCPTIAMCLTTIALWSDNMKRVRALYLANSPFMLLYDILVGSWSCAIIEVVALVSFFSAVYRFDLRKTEKAVCE